MSTKSRGFLKFFTTETGRKLVFGGACVTSISLFAANYLPNTIFIKKYREIVQCYNGGLERVLPERVLNRIDKAFDKLNISPYERTIIKPFVVYGFDTFTAGTTKSRFGGLLGIPWNYTYESVESINKQEIRFRTEMIEWNSEEGKLLAESIVLSEEEQIFAICKSILELQTQKVLLYSIYPSATFVGAYLSGSALNMRMNLYASAFSLRLILYSIIGLFGLGLWAFLKDFTQIKYETSVDKALCELGPDFILAGIQYYDKILKKNIALRMLIGDNTYTARGNENFIIRQKSLPLTIRKSYFEMRLEELKKIEEAALKL